MKIVISRLKAELEIREKEAEIKQRNVYDLTSQEHYNHLLEGVKQYKKAIEILENQDK